METAWVILADFAEIVNGKLYLVGGGWETLTLQRPDRFHQFGIAVGLKVPWQETNQIHHISVEMTADNAMVTLFKIEADLDVGRPTGLPAGSSQVVKFAMNASAIFESVGEHVVTVRVEDQLSGTLHFWVTFGPGVTSALP